MNKFIKIFCCYFIIRLAFAFGMGFHENYRLQTDSTELMPFADRASHGNFNFDYGRFIASPLYPAFAGVQKALFGQFWALALILSQLTISSLSGIYLYKITILIFKNEKIALIATVLYGLFPFTFWYVHTFCQETLFQSLFIFSIYHLIKAYQLNDKKSLILSAVLFSMAYLTKSHILIFALFIPVIFFVQLKSFKTAFVFSTIYAAICLLFSLPYGLYNQIVNNTYVLSSNGAGFQFYLGNTRAGYITVVEVPSKGTDDYNKMKRMDQTTGYFNGRQGWFDSIFILPENVKQKIFFKESIAWIKNNPSKWTKLKVFDLVLFLVPGVSYRHYEFKQWLIAFVISFPLYVLGYFGFFSVLKNDFKTHFYFLAIFFSMLLFSVVFYVQNRFRTITIEPFLIIYAAYTINYAMDLYYKKMLSNRKQKRTSVQPKTENYRSIEFRKL